MALFNIFIYTFYEKKEEVLVKFFLAFLSASFLGPLVFGAAFVPESGDGIIIGGIRSYSADTFFDRDRELIEDSDSEFSRLQLEYFWEHGIGNELSVFAFGTVYGLVKIGDNDGKRETTSSGDHEIGIKYNYALSSKWRRSVQLSTSFPLYSRSDDPLIGNHQHNFEIRHLWDDLVNTFLSFETYELAFRLRLDQPADEIRAAYTAGKNWKKNIFFFQSFLTYGLRNHEGASKGDFNTNLSSDFDQLVLGLNYARNINQMWTGQIGFSKDVLGRKVSAGQGVTLNLWKKY